MKKIVFFESHRLTSISPISKKRIISKVSEAIEQLKNLIKAMNTQSKDDLFEIKIDIIIKKLIE
ncbi:MAG: hypothetical protein [Asgard archaea virus SkuldV2]|nr:MAG: hypothetical protein [Asgard archaea virus SkuldV2]